MSDGVPMYKMYKLEGREVVLCGLEDQAEAWAIENRRIAESTIRDSWVSTVFLPVDHGFGSGPPVLFETKVFDGPLDGEVTRCHTYDEAEAMHEAMCARVRDAYNEVSDAP